jgi:hypothetical protein
VAGSTDKDVYVRSHKKKDMSSLAKQLPASQKVLRWLIMTTTTITPYCIHYQKVRRNSVVDRPNRYGLDGPGSNPGGGETFRKIPDRP